MTRLDSTHELRGDLTLAYGFEFESRRLLLMERVLNTDTGLNYVCTFRGVEVNHLVADIEINRVVSRSVHGVVYPAC